MGLAKLRNTGNGISYYGNFNSVSGYNNYIDMEFKPADITSTNPFEIVFKHYTPTATQRVMSAYTGTHNFATYLPLNTGEVWMYYANGTNKEVFTLEQIGSYANGILKAKHEIITSGSFTMTLWGLNPDNTWTQISTTRTQAWVTLPDVNITIGCLNTSGSLSNYAVCQVYYLLGDGEEFWFNEGSGSSLIGSLDTVLPIQGTLTNFWQVADFWNNPLVAGLNATEFFEISYAGKGDGSTVYIDTLVKGNDIDEFEIKFKLPVRSEQNAYGNLFGNIVDGGYFSVYMGTTYWCIFRLNASLTLFDFGGVVTEGEIYTLKATKNTSTNWTLKVTHYGGTVVYNETKETGVTTYGSTNCYIYDRNYLTRYKSKAEIYSFTINNETWHINNGHGSTITGSLGTVLNINGTLTDFWQISDIWNEDANVKMYGDGISYYGDFNNGVSNNYVDLLFNPSAITADNPFEIHFKHSSNTNRYIFGAFTSPNYFVLNNLATGNIIMYYSGTSSITIATLATIGTYADGWLKYTIRVVIAGQMTFELFGLNTDGSYTQLATSVKAITGLPTHNLYAGAFNNSGGASVTINQIAYVKGNGQEYYFNNGSGNLLTGNLGTQLTIAGTLTNFWQVADFWNNPLNEGLVKCQEFNEVQYAGKGDGTTIHINTNKYADEITSITGTFKFGNEKTGTYDTTVWGTANSGYTEYFWTRGQVDGLYVYIGSPSAPLWNLSAYMIVDNIYTLSAINNGSGSWTIALYNHTLGSQVYTNTDTITGTIPHLPIYMMARNLGGSLNYPTMRTLYNFSIDDEVWYLNENTGSTVTGSNGTVLTVNGTLTNFWQIADFPNIDAEMKIFPTELQLKNEIVEII